MKEDERHLRRARRTLRVGGGYAKEDEQVGPLLSLALLGDSLETSDEKVLYRVPLGGLTEGEALNQMLKRDPALANRITDHRRIVDHFAADPSRLAAPLVVGISRYASSSRSCQDERLDTESTKLFSLEP